MNPSFDDWLICDTCKRERQAWTLNPNGTVTCDECEAHLWNA